MDLTLETQFRVELDHAHRSGATDLAKRRSVQIRRRPAVVYAVGGIKHIRTELEGRLFAHLEVSRYGGVRRPAGGTSYGTLSQITGTNCTSRNRAERDQRKGCRIQILNGAACAHDATCRGVLLPV